MTWNGLPVLLSVLTPSAVALIVLVLGFLIRKQGHS